MRGTDAFSPVTDDYDPWDNDFTGTINKIVSDSTTTRATAQHVCRN
jgi:hypothetical protein